MHQNKILRNAPLQCMKQRKPFLMHFLILYYSGTCSLWSKLKIADSLKYLKSRVGVKWFLVTHFHLSWNSFTLRKATLPHPLILCPAPSCTKAAEPLLQALFISVPGWHIYFLYQCKYLFSTWVLSFVIIKQNLKQN